VGRNIFLSITATPSCSGLHCSLWYWSQHRSLMASATKLAMGQKSGCGRRRVSVYPDNQLSDEVMATRVSKFAHMPRPQATIPMRSRARSPALATTPPTPPSHPAVAPAAVTLIPSPPPPPGQGAQAALGLRSNGPDSLKAAGDGEWTLTDLGPGAEGLYSGVALKSEQAPGNDVQVIHVMRRGRALTCTSGLSQQR
jgi:hypothetical protein